MGSIVSRMILNTEDGCQRWYRPDVFDSGMFAMTFFDGGRIYLNKKPSETMPRVPHPCDVAVLVIHTPLLGYPLIEDVSDEDYEKLKTIIFLEDDSPQDAVRKHITGLM